MGTLEAVFNSREFDMNDDVLMEFYNYFNKESRDYNNFSLAEKDILTLRTFVEELRHIDSNSTIYVCTYGYEITNSKGEKSTYADALWIDSVLSISQIEELIEKNGVVEPSDISLLEDCVEIGNGNIWVIKQEKQNPQIIKLTDRNQINRMVMLYWD